MDLVGMGALAFIAGVLSFTSPCCLPLMPGYVSFISGTAAGRGAGEGTVAVAAPSRTRPLWAAMLFVAGFGMVFTAFGAGASALGGELLANRQLLTRAGGVMVLFMGLVLAGVVRVPLLLREYRMDLSRIRPGPAGALPLGMAFAVGWVPCIGPVLASILALAASEGSAGRGAGLLAVYSLGLGLPFMGLAVAASRLDPLVRWLRRHGRQVELAGAAVLLVMGLLLITDQWLRFFAPLTRLFTSLGWPPI